MSIPPIMVRIGEGYTFGLDYGPRLARGDRITGVTSVAQIAKTGGAPDLTIGTPNVSTSHNGINFEITVSDNATVGDTYTILCKASSPLGINIPETVTLQVEA